MLLLLLSLGSCRQEKKIDQDNFVLSIRFDSEPDVLHPVLSRNAEAKNVEKLLFSTLQAPDPQTLELIPILLSEKMSSEEDNAGRMWYNLHFREDVKWDNGSHLTIYDFIFSVKAAMNPKLPNRSWANFLQIIDSFSYQTDDLYSMQLLLGESSMQAEEIISDISVFPEYIYDPSHMLRSISLAELHSTAPTDSTVLGNRLNEIAQNYSTIELTRQNPTGSGPYRLTEWVTNERLVFTRKENWWGDDFDDIHGFLANRPKEIIYYIVPDEQTAIANLKSGAIDLLYGIQPDQFAQLLQDSSTANLQLKTAPVLQYYFIGYNNQDPVLSSKSVRNAISRTMDMELAMDRVFYHLAQRTNGPIHPSKPYYNHDISPVEFNLDEARELLAADGWQDADNDGILDKIIEGTAYSLSIDLLTTPSGLSKDLGAILQQNATQVGININIVAQDFPLTLRQLRAKNYQMAALVSRGGPGLYDPYNSWHSDNSGINGTNYCGFTDDRCDELIEAIRTSTNDQQRNVLYREFSQIIHEEQPALFLVCPEVTIAANQQLDFQTTAIRPGFIENNFMKK